MRDFKKTFLELFSPVCTSRVYTVEFHLLDHLVEYIKKVWHILVLDTSTYDQFNVHIKTAYRGSSR